MKSLFLLVLVLSTTSCMIDFTEYKSKSSSDYLHDKTSFDLQDIETGLKVKFIEGVEPSELSLYVRVWNELQACTGLSASPAPYIMIVPELQFEDGKFYTTDKVIEVQTTFEVNLDSQILRHEMLHYLLDFNGTTGPDNTEHLSYYFPFCTYGNSF